MAQLKWKGFVLMESMFSMVIIMTSFSICMMTFSTMTENQRNYLAVKAQIALCTEANRCKSEQIWLDEDIPGIEFTMQRRMHLDDTDPNIGVLEIKAVTPDGKTLSEYHEFVFVK